MVSKYPKAPVDRDDVSREHRRSNERLATNPLTHVLAREAAAIPMAACRSKSVAAHGYDPATETLALRFRNGTTYHYGGVPADVAKRLAGAESIGQFVQAHIKGQFPAEKQ